jgi:protein DGCR14
MSQQPRFPRSTSRGQPSVSDQSPASLQPPTTPTWSELGPQDAADRAKSAPSVASLRDSGPDTRLTLDQFLHRYTSEDNASFDAIIQATNERLQAKFERLFGVVKAKADRLALPDGKDSGVSFALDGWAHVPKNRLMWYPSELPKTASELIALSKQAHNTINYGNTRFKRDPYPSTGSSSRGSSTRGTSTRHGVVLLGVDRAAIFTNRIKPTSGSHGYGHHPDTTPSVQGYAMVTTPSPAPGQDLDPTMTWGVMHGQPTLVHDLQHVEGTVFNIPLPGPREQLGHRLADDKAKKRRSTSTTPRAHSRPGTLTSQSRLASMSPAARQLAERLGQTRAKGLNRALRHQYATSHRGLGTRLTPRVTPRGTPSSTTPVGKATPAGKAMATPQGLETGVQTKTGDSGLTDDLL